MGQRREPRITAKIPVRVMGTDADGKIFSQRATTLDVSRCGVRIPGIEAALKSGEIIGVTCGTKKSRYRVAWMGEAGTDTAGHAGLEAKTPENCIWEVDLPAACPDSFQRQPGSDRRVFPRLRVTVSAELYPQGQEARIMGHISDLSLGGCFVEMPMPLAKDTKLKLVFWIKETKLTTAAEVSSSRPGFGIGIRFLEMPDEDRERLQQFIKSLPRSPF